MLNLVDIFLLRTDYVTNRLSPEEKKQLKEWRSLSPENESYFQDLIDPEKHKARWERAEAMHNEYLRIKEAVNQKLKAQFPDVFGPKKVRTRGKHKAWSKKKRNELATKIKK